MLRRRDLKSSLPAVGILISSETREMSSNLMSKREVKIFSGLSAVPAKAWLVSKLVEQSARVIVVCADLQAVDDLYQDLRFFSPRLNVLRFLPWDILPYEPVSPQTDIVADRILALRALSLSEPFLILTVGVALLQNLPTPQLLRYFARSLRVGDAISRDSLLRLLDACGFIRVSLVEEVGQFSVRGGVVDIFPRTHSKPVRLEFFDDVIEEIRLFDNESQRSVATLEECLIEPVKEWIPFHALPNGLLDIAGALSRVKAVGKRAEIVPREIARVVAAVRTGIHFPGMELTHLAGLESLRSFLDLVAEDVRVVLNDPLAIDHSLAQFERVIIEREARRHATLIAPPQETLYTEAAACFEQLRTRADVQMDALAVLDDASQGEYEVTNLGSSLNINLSTALKSKVGSGNALEPLAKAVAQWRLEGYAVAFVVGSEQRGRRLHSLLLEVDIDAPLLDISFGEWSERRTTIPVAILQGFLTSGMRMPGLRVVCISEREIFQERSQRRRGAKGISLKRIMSSLGQLAADSYVVHVDYGIALYRGLVHMDRDEVVGDFLQLEYADSTLYLPVHHIGKVHKFAATEGSEPQLDKLGSKRWVKTKQRVRDAVMTLAADLVRIYAARKVVSGWRFDPAGAQDEEFADSFPFEETRDQVKAIAETLMDMSNDRPMDRLICGDVGFGKTEVAIRAAFKCVQHARQVAVLVPTTILVAQHLESFRRRFLGYPVVVEGVSRFLTPEKNREVLQGLRSGDVDIVVGTHKLLSNDVQFKDLGLLIIDEEHRFGVKQKEQLKQFRAKIDVLTLTATPIPRTLNMALLGIRDISVISTPPTDRRVIRTYIAEYSDTVVRDAILRELQRGGQVFYLHNRVETIAGVAAELARLVPEARVDFAHGQMRETLLEGIMRRFIEGESNVLVSTTIIESGIDIPRANTIIITNAHMFGLAQLYQLRGRVGRSDRQAYAYFLIPRVRTLGQSAQARLKALQALDDLGVGFQLAIRDLEIRGAGNLLGREQSGNVVAVGYELYSRILDEAVRHLRGEEQEISERVDPDLKFRSQGYIPDEYIPDISEKLVLYQRLAGALSDGELDELAEEMRDRFGPFPAAVAELVEVMRFRAFLRRFGVVRAEVARGRLALTLSPAAPVDLERILELTHDDSGRCRFTKNLTLSISLGDGEPDISVLQSISRTVLGAIGREDAGGVRAVSAG